MDAENSDKKHAAFNKYKGRINNYLTKRGYDLVKERNEWYKRLKQPVRKSDGKSLVARQNYSVRKVVYSFPDKERWAAFFYVAGHLYFGSE